MKKYNLNSFYIINSLKNHSEINKNLLKYIDEMPNNRYKQISKTDWNLPKELNRNYLTYFYSQISIIMNLMLTELKFQNWVIHEGWFQQYNKNDRHNMHVHPNCHFTNIYFVELPDANYKTELYNSGFDSKIDLDNITEGDLLTFPSYIYHRSNEIKNDVRKTIISFNSSFE